MHITFLVNMTHVRLNRRARYDELILDILGIVPRNPQLKHLALSNRKPITRSNEINTVFKAPFEHVSNPSIEISTSLSSGIAHASLQGCFFPRRLAIGY